MHSTGSRFRLGLRGICLTLTPFGIYTPKSISSKQMSIRHCIFWIMLPRCVVLASRFPMSQESMEMLKQAAMLTLLSLHVQVRIPMFEDVGQFSVQRSHAGLLAADRPFFGPSHLLFLAESFAHHFVHCRLHKSRRDRLAVTISLTIRRDQCEGCVACRLRVNKMDLCHPLSRRASADHEHSRQGSRACCHPCHPTAGAPHPLCLRLPPPSDVTTQVWQ